MESQIFQYSREFKNPNLSSILWLLNAGLIKLKKYAGLRKNYLSLFFSF